MRRILITFLLLLLAAVGLDAQTTSPRPGIRNGLVTVGRDPDSLYTLPPVGDGTVGQVPIFQGIGQAMTWGTVASGDTVISGGGTDTVIIARITTELADEEWSGSWYERVAGEKLFYGEAVYANPVTGKVHSAKATNADSMPAIGVVVSPDSVLADTAVQILFSGSVCDNSWSFTPNNPIYVDTTTAGNLIDGFASLTASGNVAVVLGTALTDSSIIINVNLNEVVASGVAIFNWLDFDGDSVNVDSTLTVQGTADFRDAVGVDGALTANGNLIMIGDDILYRAAIGEEFNVQSGTSDGDDTLSVVVSGGGASANTRGGHVAIFGNEFSTAASAGDVQLIPGEAGEVELYDASGDKAIAIEDDSVVALMPITLGASAYINLNLFGLADSSVQGLTFMARAGEALTFGDLVYWKNDSLFLARGDTVGNTDLLPVAALCADKTIAGGAVGLFLKDGFAKATGWDFTRDAMLYVDTTAGGQLSEYPPTVSGMISQPMGTAQDSIVVDFNPVPILTIK